MVLHWEGGRVGMVGVRVIGVMVMVVAMLLVLMMMLVMAMLVNASDGDDERAQIPASQFQKT